MLTPPAPDEPYGRTLLTVSDTEEVLAMTWRAGATCAPHDHGQAGGSVSLIRGSLSETTYVFSREGLIPTTTRVVHAPAILEVAPGVIHAMTAHDEALTIHRYTPRIAHMRVYDIGGRRTFIVKDDCGAWIPRDDADVVALDPWPIAGYP